MEATFTTDAGNGGLVLALVALPTQRAAALVATKDGQGVLSTIEPGAGSARNVDNVPMLSRTEGPIGYCTALCRVGAGFALVSEVETIRCRAFGTQPEHFTRVDSFRPNAHGFTVGVARGGLSDDPSAALVVLHEPQVIDGATRYALLRFDESTRQARWEWTDDAGEPPALDKEDLPIPDFWRSSRHFDEIRPYLDHGSWVGGQLRLFALGGLTANFVRWGMDYSIAAVVTAGRVCERWVAQEPSWGFFASSGRHLILRPLRARGPSKGAPSVLDLGTGELSILKLPRGMAQWTAADYCDGTYWLVSNDGRLAACREVA